MCLAGSAWRNHLQGLDRSHRSFMLLPVVASHSGGVLGGMANIRSYGNLPTRIALPTALVASVVASLIVELIIAAIAHGAGAYSDFQPLTLGGLIRLCVLSDG